MEKRKHTGKQQKAPLYPEYKLFNKENKRYGNFKEYASFFHMWPFDNNVILDIKAISGQAPKFNFQQFLCPHTNTMTVSVSAR